jgi:2-aminoadipate transaminase
LIEAGYLEEEIPKLRAAYRERRDTMLDALQNHFPAGSRWTKPEGGMFLFVSLPEGMEAGKMLARALEQNIAYVPGEAFYLDGAGRNTLRLNFTHTRPAEIRVGIQRLGEILSGL